MTRRRRRARAICWSSTTTTASASCSRNTWPAPASGSPPRPTRARGAQAARRRCDFDLLVLDVMMPGEDGFSLTRWLRDRPGRPGATPVLMLTAAGAARRPHRGPEPGRRRLSGQALRAARSCCCASRRSCAARGDRPAAGGPLSLGRCSFDPDRGELDRRRRAGAPDRGGGAPAAPARRARRTRRSTAWSWPAATADAAGRAVDVQVTRLRRKIEADPQTRATCRPCAASATCWRPD